MYFSKESGGQRGKDMEIQQYIPYSPFFPPRLTRTVRQPAVFLFFREDLSVMVTDKIGFNLNLNNTEYRLERCVRVYSQFQERQDLTYSTHFPEYFIGRSTFSHFFRFQSCKRKITGGLGFDRLIAPCH